MGQRFSNCRSGVRTGLPGEAGFFRTVSNTVSLCTCCAYACWLLGLFATKFPACAASASLRGSYTGQYLFVSSHSTAVSSLMYKLSLICENASVTEL